MYNYTFPKAAGLGRNILHDPRSRDYAFDAAGITYKSVRHKRYVPVLDQGQVGSCTGNAGTGALGSGSFFQTLPTGLISTTDARAAESFAVSLYGKATAIDPFTGTYPPNDTGSNGLSIAKVCKKEGWIAGYQHCFTFDSFLKALTINPVIAGVGWYDSMYNPDSNGLISISKDAALDGGHEIVLDEIDAERKLIGGTNSWSERWGVKGRFYIGFDTFERLLNEKGDVTVFVAKEATTPPGPVNPLPPAPVTTATPEDVALWADIQKWAKLKGLI